MKESRGERRRSRWGEIHVFDRRFESIFRRERFMVIIESRKILSQKNEHTQVKNRLTNGALTDIDTWRSLTGGLTFKSFINHQTLTMGLIF